MKAVGRLSSNVVLARRSRCRHVRWRPLRRVIREILEAHDTPGTVSVAIVTDEEIQRIHKEFLGEDTPTDVLTFPLQGPERAVHDDTLGEIVLSADTALREARRRRLRPDREIALYALHGALHLVGFDDVRPRERSAMRRAERKYLGRYEAHLRARRASRG